MKRLQKVVLIQRKTDATAFNWPKQGHPTEIFAVNCRDLLTRGLPLLANDLEVTAFNWPKQGQGQSTEIFHCKPL